jgi:hypothetical protein
MPAGLCAGRAVVVSAMARTEAAARAGARARPKRRHCCDGVLQVEETLLIQRNGGLLRWAVDGADALSPAGAPLPQELPDQDGIDVAIGVVRTGCLLPVQVDLDDGGLGQIVGAVPVMAQQEGKPSQRRQPRGDVVGEILITVLRHEVSR